MIEIPNLRMRGKGGGLRRAKCFNAQKLWLIFGSPDMQWTDVNTKEAFEGPKDGHLLAISLNNSNFKFQGNQSQMRNSIKL